MSRSSGVGCSWVVGSFASGVTLVLCVCRRRRGAINAKQLAFLEKYRPKGLWLKRKEKECSIM